MENTSYWKIYNLFLGKITDFDLPQMSDDELLGYCDSLLFSALVKVKSFDHDLSLRNDAARTFESVLSDTECEVLACQMVVEWVERKTNTTQNIHMFVGTKDESMASQANHIKVLLELKNNQKAIVTALIRDWKYREWIEEDE